MKPGREYSYAGLSISLCRGALERPWLPLTMWKAFFNRSLDIGVRAVPTVFLMAFCVGSVVAIVLIEQLQELSMEETVPRLIWIILNQQLAPMLAAVVFIGRSVSGSAAELANMKIGEEIKALETMGVDVSRYLLLPLLGGFVVMLPVMEIYTVGVGLLGAHGVCSLVMAMDAKQFVLRALVPPRMQDAFIGGGRCDDCLPQGAERHRRVGRSRACGNGGRGVFTRSGDACQRCHHGAAECFDCGGIDEQVSKEATNQ